MADRDGPQRTIDRRTLLIGGGAGLGLIVAWAVWPRRYSPNLTAAAGEHIFNAWLKIAESGEVTVVVPQAELGQGVYTTLPQIAADELGADWRTVGVEAAPLNALYANPLAAGILFEDALGHLPESVQRRHAERNALVLTGASTSIRAFEEPLRRAGAAARILLCKAAADRWSVDWRSCGTVGGFVVHDRNRLRFGELAAAASEYEPPRDLVLRSGADNRLSGASVPRLDTPAKVDGSANFAGDVRLPGMMFASVRQGPVGDTRLIRVDREAADRVPGVRHIVQTDSWVAAVAETWWAADKALDALAPRFATRGAIVDSASIEAALATALDGDGQRISETGDLATSFRDAQIVTAEYQVGLGVHAPIETMTATAEWRDGRLALWLPTQAPGLARAGAARAAGIDESDVVVHPMMAGGSFGAKLEYQVAEQAALMARTLEKPIQLTWSRSEDCLHDRYRPAAAGRLSARLGRNGAVEGWLTKIAAPSVGRELANRLLGGDPAVALSLSLPGGSAGDASAVAGAVPIYGIPNMAVDHHPAEIGVPVGAWRSGAHSYTTFFTESFIDELAHVAGIEAHSFRISMLGGQPRLARCLSTVASLGGWRGGVPGSGQGLAAHAFRGSSIAVLAEARIGGDQRIRVDRLVAAVDCGRQINPDMVRQQVEGGLLFGMASALGASTGFTGNLADARGFADLRLPRLADAPEVTVELIASEADPGGVGEIGVPAVAPAIANAIWSATGMRLRRLPLIPGSDA
ncbi:xanthine dehydrogenase family protein molybdopterin-binding subunit [Stakelama saccharophila]|uniref:Molybdopterin cofactor-binding domain-containing protein n=1 Tax=Stakelama saccharophila TaxID=3075605 RepID=A0ABZ0BBD5_9SPHN|nr:molybdopterin cofactor-binding domain-containing protein [Stakelama sp. W311]WNO54742.1 molybdopterin cofactor-binding domain-containing protein [Stakelama sp. W311]